MNYFQVAQLFFANFIECTDGFVQNCFVDVANNYLDCLHGFIVIDLSFEDYWLLFFDSYFWGFIGVECDGRE